MSTTPTAQQLFDQAFNRPRDPRSAPYKEGVLATLEFRIDRKRLSNPYPAGSARSDAFTAGTIEGHAIWRTASEIARNVAIQQEAPAC